jgi:hypothetical protein
MIISVKEPMLKASTPLASEGHDTTNHYQVVAGLMMPNLIRALIQRGALRWTQSAS